MELRNAKMRFVSTATENVPHLAIENVPLDSGDEPQVVVSSLVDFRPLCLGDEAEAESPWSWCQSSL